MKFPIVPINLLTDTPDGIEISGLSGPRSDGVNYYRLANEKNVEFKLSSPGIIYLRLWSQNENVEGRINIDGNQKSFHIARRIELNTSIYAKSIIEINSSCNSCYVTYKIIFIPIPTMADPKLHISAVILCVVLVGLLYKAMFKKGAI